MVTRPTYPMDSIHRLVSNDTMLSEGILSSVSAAPEVFQMLGMRTPCWKVRP